MYGLTCNHAIDPVGMDSLPAFSWKYKLQGKTQRQHTYRICVASSRDNLHNEIYDCWDSGAIESAESHFVEYEGQPLHPGVTHHWQVTVAGTDGSSCTEQATFETGRLTERWSARWLSAAHQTRQDDAVDAPCLRKEFALAGQPARARLHICSPGYFDASINGERVSDEQLPTPFTKYDSRLFYCTYDVTALLRPGGNAMGVAIGNGWYNCFTEDVWNSRQATWRDVPKLIAELHIDLEDGSHQVVATDSTWKSAKGPTVFNGIRNGEFYDARLEHPGWTADGFDDSGWDAARISRPPGGHLEAMEMEPIRVTGTIKPVAHWQTPEGSHVFDTGQNMAGFAAVTVEGAVGDEITIRYSERLHEDEVHIDQSTVAGFVRSGEFQTDKYFKFTAGTETWQPRFVYHGFQYIEVSGGAGVPQVDALVVHTDVADAGEFSCADDTLNAVQHASRWATLTNLHGLPTDDPHREKNAWTGDVALSAEQMLLNFHTTPLLRKWLADIRDSQRPDGAIPCVVPSTGWGYNWGNGPDWSSALTHIPWQIYLYTGDRRVLRENYEAITRHFGYMESMAEDGITHYGIGDWCAPFEGRALLVNMASFKAPTELTDTACYYNAADTLTKMATVLGLGDDAQHFDGAAQTIKTAFRERFFEADSHRVAGDCQTSTACMLYQGLHEGQEGDALMDVLLQQIADKDDHLDTGILGSKYLFNVLGQAGRMDVALKMVLNPTFPSFRDWMDRGATTLWECWNGEGSRNHHMFSDISAVMYKYLGGIRPDEAEPGFRHILMAPAVDCGLASVQCSHESPFGPIVSNWERVDDSVRLDISIPGGARATLDLPAGFSRDDYVRDLAPGSHQFTVGTVA